MSDKPLSIHPDEITLDVYIDRELTESERSEIAAHLRECPSCREYVEARRALFALIAESEELSPSMDITTGVLESLQRARWHVLTRVLSLEAVLAALLLVLVGPSFSADFSSLPAREVLMDSRLWLGDLALQLGSQLEVGLRQISGALELLTIPTFAGFPVIHLTWMHWAGILTGILFVWLLLNRVLIGEKGLQRSRAS